MKKGEGGQWEDAARLRGVEEGREGQPGRKRKRGS